ncbi:isoleucine--tRNA ligase [Candidatus Synchoanobacter obligatus]|uniref:Isoleucine--tRNA ligase n=1 Tax=Candidatus Synchoanobacter obligatus TaxID=2919597 RepID=A0ABT1L633_9GAMM|nr:isoleucine--tRNA ligase [Candidatus Synchoanobacter obligatus]MCP8351913.1 isoleucine--tRNA ligase [Candidatus Synchoanobacter obligatus]
MMSFSFVDNEARIRQFWHDEDIFKKSLKKTETKPRYTFYDGPPFATGKPHHGHLLASTIKDVVHRYFTQQGYYVERRFGWDCHGLPIEHEINQSLGLQAHEAVEQLGVAGYNQACRDIVMRYSEQWQSTIERLGRWVEFDNDYKTMDCDFMESVWWVFHELWDKGMIYEGVKVVPFSTSLETALSNFEAGSNYQSVQDPSITVLLSLVNQDAYLAIWTTTPWTLPANQAIAVSPEITYALVEIEGYDKPVWLCEANLDAIIKKTPYTVIETASGASLVGQRYQPLFPELNHDLEDSCFQILPADFIETDTGTGLVHLAPSFGEDDYNVCQAHGILTLLCPINDQGRFNEEIAAVAGLYIKDADKVIIKTLKTEKRLFNQDVIEHSYPFCPRSDTPLIYKAIPSWFVAVSKIKDKLAANNQKIRWVPEHIKDGRFGKWIDNARDWAISRNRVWGTPIPLWRNDVTGTIICISSVQELASLTGKTLTDLHREHVDPLTFEKPGEEGTYRRVPEVLDCWFESGSMPYAQAHYPFKNQSDFEQTFPAEFIAEGLDQTRGWFYTLNILSTILFDQPAFKNVIVNGLVAAEDGKKMSKRLRNYTPPDELMATYGADALRLYLISSNLTKGEEQRFANNGVKDITRTTLLPWYNAFKFFQTYAEIDQWQSCTTPLPYTKLDQWIVSRLQTLIEGVNQNMQAYKLYLVVPPLLSFIDELTNTYIRMNRSRFWGDGQSDDKNAAYQTLFQVLSTLSKLMAPFAPYLSEHIHLSLKPFSSEDTEQSVHLCDYPTVDVTRQNIQLETGVQMLQEIITMARNQRVSAQIKTKTPLQSITIIHKDPAIIEALAQLSDRLKVELNVKEVHFSQDEAHYVTLYAKPNLPILGKKYGRQLPEIKAIIANLADSELRTYEATGTLTLDKTDFEAGDLLVLREIKSNVKAVSNCHITISLDTTLTETLIQEGLAREVISQIQKTRKSLDLAVDQRIRLVVSGNTATTSLFKAHEDYILKEVLALDWQHYEAEQNHIFDQIEGSFSIVLHDEE